MPAFLTLNVSVAWLLGVLMYSGGCGATREMTAARASASSLYRLAIPVNIP